jgi:hypothetical protein
MNYYLQQTFAVQIACIYKAFEIISGFSIVIISEHIFAICRKQEMVSP